MYIINMNHSLLFFPWITLDKTYQIGGYELIPVTNQTISQFSQDEVDVLNIIKQTWFIKFNNPIFAKLPLNQIGISLDSFTIAKKVGTPNIFQEVHNDDEIAEFFLIKEVLALDYFFNRRKVFDTTHKYFNTDSFYAVVQMVKNKKLDIKAIVSKRFDGSNTSFGPKEWVTEVKPNHIQHGETELNQVFCNDILSIMKTDNWINAFVRNFNQVFTDNPALSSGKEVNNAVSAMEKLAIGINGVQYSHQLKEERFVENILDIIKSYQATNPTWQIPSELLTLSPKRLVTRDSLNQKNTKPSTWYPDEALKCWLMDVYRVRNHYAHGNYLHRDFIWSESEHILLFALIGPILLKLRLLQKHSFTNFPLRTTEVNALTNLGKILVMEDLAASHPSSHHNYGSRILSDYIYGSFPKIDNSFFTFIYK